MEERCSKFPKIIGCRECRRPMEYEIARWREYTSPRGTQWLVWGRVELCVPMTHGPISLVHEQYGRTGAALAHPYPSCRFLSSSRLSRSQTRPDRFRPSSSRRNSHRALAPLVLLGLIAAIRNPVKVTRQ